MVTAAESEAERHHLRGAITVVDDGGWAILIERMDNSAYTASVELAPAKARTAALFMKPSQALEYAIDHGRVAAVTARDFTEIQGGLPIVVDGQAPCQPGIVFWPVRHTVSGLRNLMAATFVEFVRHGVP
jgi:glc operon protein GlcG